jgi:prepilin signal peptidase PulO-like enzyme (type II secretory pathway)
MNVAVIIFLAVLGAGLGSFACCQAWRLRKHDKSARSHCMNCDYQLKWYDNIPIFSWLFLLGKCRKCRKPIGFAEIFAEVCLAALFALSYVFWPRREDLLAGNVLEVAKYVTFLVQSVVFMILAVYDAKWKEMPTSILLVSVVVGLVYFVLNFVLILMTGKFAPELIMSLVGAIVILPGFYYFMYKASKETWVGSGDAILCLPLAIMLGDFWLSMFCLFGSNMIGSIVMLPVTVVKKEKHAMIPFGPFLIAGFLTVYFLQDAIANFISI